MKLAARCMYLLLLLIFSSHHSSQDSAVLVLVNFGGRMLCCFVGEQRKDEGVHLMEELRGIINVNRKRHVL